MEKAAGVFFPSAADIAAIKVGGMAPNAFGKLAEVVEVSYRGVDVNGRAFVGYYTAFGPHSSMSCSLKESTVLRHAGLRMSSAEIDALEAKLRAEAAAVPVLASDIYYSDGGLSMPGDGERGW